MKNIFILALLTVLLNGCAVGPNYVKPSTPMPTKFKEVGKNWVVAKPQDDFDRGNWWTVFNDPQLNNLENQLNISNQTIAVAAAQYQQALDLVDAARAGYFPTITGTATATRQGQGSISSNTASSSSLSQVSITSNHSILFAGSWEPDLWGSVRRTVEASRAGAQANAAQLALVKLSAQATLAQSYFQLRALDTDQKLLDNTVKDYQKSLAITKNRYAVGVAAQADVIQAQTQLESAQAAAINNGILRAQFEHAIAVLIGEPPEVFSFKPQPLTATPPRIPLQVPSILLERRPDIAQAERLMAQANAQIGVAEAAYFPALTISASGGWQGSGVGNWLSLPTSFWAIAPSLAETIFDGGLRSATTAAARANYNAAVATYRQTVLAGFQDVEDNLVNLRLLAAQSAVQNQAATDARKAAKLVMNQYNAGTVDYTAVVTAQTTAYAAEKSAADINGLRMTAATGLIRALGGGWNANDFMVKYNP